MSAPERVETEFLSGGERCAAWLHLPPGPGPHPVVVMLHSTAGLRPMRCYAERGDAFAAAGVAALQFECRGFGESEGEPRLLLDVRRQAEDLAAALVHAASLPALDAAAAALWGASASCGIVLDAAARSPRVRAVVCLTPFVPGRATQRVAGTPLGRIAAAAFADRLRIAAGREPRGVKIGGDPGEAAILVREDAARRERALVPDGVDWENRVILRLRLRSPNPRRLAPKVRCPLLVVAGSEDQLCPPGPAAEVAERAPAGRLLEMPSGHFDLYEGASIEAETAFLAEQLVEAECG